MRGSNPTQAVILSDPLVGMRLGEYAVLEVIGEGGMGVVYSGVQPVIKKRVAIKVLKPNMAGDETQVRRLADEAVAVNSRLKSPSVTPSSRKDPLISVMASARPAVALAD